MAIERGAPRAIAACIIVVLLAGCATAPQTRAPPQMPSAAPAPAPATPAPAGFPSGAYDPAPPDGRVHRIDAEESQIDIYVYRAGRLMRLGHNHIVTTRAVEGYVFVADEPGRTRLDLYFPVESMSVDEPELRAAAGEQFASLPSPSDIAGTRKNLLGERMLDAAAYPFILVSGIVNGGTASEPALDLTITVRGIAHPVHAVARVERAGDTLRASGEIKLSHAQLGLEPFSVFGGALSVEDGFDIRYRIAAVAR